MIFNFSLGERESIELDNLINSSLAFCSKNLGSKTFKIVVDKKNEIERKNKKYSYVGN